MIINKLFTLCISLTLVSSASCRFASLNELGFGNFSNNEENLKYFVIDNNIFNLANKLHIGCRISLCKRDNVYFNINEGVKFKDSSSLVSIGESQDKENQKFISNDSNFSFKFGTALSLSSNKGIMSYFDITFSQFDCVLEAKSFIYIKKDSVIDKGKGFNNANSKFNGIEVIKVLNDIRPYFLSDYRLIRGYASLPLPSKFPIIFKSDVNGSGWDQQKPNIYSNQSPTYSLLLHWKDNLPVNVNYVNHKAQMIGVLIGSCFYSRFVGVNVCLGMNYSIKNQDVFLLSVQNIQSVFLLKGGAYISSMHLGSASEINDNIDKILPKGTDSSLLRNSENSFLKVSNACCEVTVEQSGMCELYLHCSFMLKILESMFLGSRIEFLGVMNNIENKSLTIEDVIHNHREEVNIDYHLFNQYGDVNATASGLYAAENLVYNIVGVTDVEKSIRDRYDNIMELCKQYSSTIKIYLTLSVFAL